MSAGRGAAALTEEQIGHILRSMADSFGQQLRSPILHWPSEQDLDYEDVTFPALDGVPLEGWFIPAAGSDKLIIANHPMGFSRSGIPAHLEPWKSVSATTSFRTYRPDAIGGSRHGRARTTSRSPTPRLAVPGSTG